MSARVTHRDCAGQADLVRTIKRDLDQVMTQDMAGDRLERARRLASSLSRELKSLQTMCTTCRGE